MQSTLAGGSVTEKSKAYVVRSFILFGKPNSRPDRNLTAYNSVATIKMVLPGKEVHRPPLAFGATGGFTVQFSHGRVGCNTF